MQACGGIYMSRIAKAARVVFKERQRSGEGTPGAVPEPAPNWMKVTKRKSAASGPQRII